MSRALFLVVILMSLLSGCNYQRNNLDSNLYFKPYFDDFKTAGNQDKFREILKLDSIFSHYHNPSLADELQYYYLKADYNYQIQGDKNTGEDFINKMIATANKRGKMDSSEASLYYKGLEYKARICLSRKSYDSGFMYLAEAQIQKKKFVTDTCNLENSNTIPDLLFQQNNYSYAIKHYLQNIGASLNCSPLTFERFALAQNSLNSVGLSYFNMGKFDSAAYYLDSASSFIENSRKLFPNNSFLNLAAGVVFNTKGYLSQSLSHLDNAELFYRKSLNIVEKDYPDFSIDTRMALASLYFSEKKWKEMRLTLDSTEKQLYTVKDERLWEDFYNSKVRYYEAMGLYDSALANSKKYNEASRRFDQQKRELKELDVETKLSETQTRFERDLLAKDVSIKKSQLWIIGLISVGMLFTGFFLWAGYKRSVRHVKELEHLTSEISLSHEDLQQSFAALEQSHTENKRLIRTVAHDFKNPIWGINSISNSLGKRLTDEDAKNAMELISTTCKNLLDTINDLLPDKIVEEKERKDMVDMSRMLEGCARLLQAKAAQKKQTISLTSQSLIAPINREKIWRVISNLIHNAIKFSQEGSEINLNLSAQNNMAVLAVRDSGIGIPKEIGEKIFLLDEASKTRIGTSGEKSYGLGLSISKKIVEEHNGKIWFETEVGKGTVFYVSLPMVRI